MRKYSAGFISTVCQLGLVAVGLCAVPAGFADGTNKLSSIEEYDYAKPELLTGTLYEIGSDRKTVLYTFRRTATRSGSTVNVHRQFLGTNGSVAAEEDVTYESGQLVSFQMKEFQEQVSGAIQIQSDPKNPGGQKLVISFGHGLTPPKGVTEKLLPDTLIDDTLFPFMMVHWDDLMQGRAAKFHFISLEHERTFEFRLIKTGEFTQAGRMVEQIKMEPVNFFVAELVNPLVFNVEKDGQHHILSYTGRTTPRIKKGKAWKYLDAETVFDWK